MRSIRSYLITRILGSAALVLAVAGLLVYFVVARSLEAQFDRNLTDRVAGLAALLFQHDNMLRFEFSDELMPEYDEQRLPAYFELWLEDGQLVERSNSLGERDLELAAPPTRAPAHWTAPLPDGRRGRYVVQSLPVHHVYPEEGPDRPEPAIVWIALARGREDLLAAERSVLVQCALAALALLLVIGGITWTAVNRGLAPARRFAAMLDRIEVDDLPERLEPGRLPSELTPVAEKTDALIRRVDTALTRERRTSADIAHELRTPISELLTVSEVALRNGHDLGDDKRALGKVRDVAWRMGRSVSTLLKLARLEMGAESFAVQEVGLGRLVAEQLRALAGIEREQELDVRNLVPADAAVLGDPDVLNIVVANLLGNALYYSPAGGRVRCALEEDGAGWRLAVENEAPGLQQADLGTLAEPFWRKDRARADRDRSGLGLALSTSLARQSGLELRFEIEAGRFRALLSRAALHGAPRA